MGRGLHENESVQGSGGNADCGCVEETSGGLGDLPKRAVASVLMLSVFRKNESPLGFLQFPGHKGAKKTGK